MIGLGLADVTKGDFDWKFINGLLAAKFIIWPLISIAIIIFDLNYLHLYSKEIHSIIFLLSIVPVAANTVAFSAELGTKPEKAAIGVVITTLFAIGVIPLMMGLFLNFYHLFIFSHLS